MALPARARYLDPRLEHAAKANPIRDSVNIPLPELANRMHELPQKGEPVIVAADGELLARTLEFLEEHGRRAAGAESIEFGPNTPSRLWDANEFLMRILPQLAPGRAVDLGCGTGRNAVALAAFGLHVTAIDILPDALDRGKDLAARYLPPGTGSIEWLPIDLETAEAGLPESYDLMASFFYLNREWLAKADQFVVPNGSIIIETFTTTHREKTGKPRREHLALRPGELRDLLPAFAVLEYEEAWHGDRHTARYHGRRL